MCIQSGLTPLHVASFCGYAMLVEQLLGEGADVHSRGQCGETPLHMAAVGSTTTVVNLLLNAAANVNDAMQVSSFVKNRIQYNTLFHDLFSCSYLHHCV